MTGTHQAVISFKMKMPITVRKEGKWYISCCPILNVYSQGDSHDKAVSNLIEAMRLFVESCYERGTLDQVLKESGFHATQVIAENTHDDTEVVDIDFPPLVAQYSAENCAH